MPSNGAADDILLGFMIASVQLGTMSCSCFEDSRDDVELDSKGFCSESSSIDSIISNFVEGDFSVLSTRECFREILHGFR
jgi:hypothetical protein